MRAARVSEEVSTTVIGDTKVDLGGLNVVEPEEVECGIDLLEVGVRLD